MKILIGLALCGLMQLVVCKSALLENFAYPKDYHSGKLRIINGQEASPHQFPYEVGLYISYQLKSSFCGGSLISQNFVLTAAHCLEGAISVSAIIGAHNISDSSETGRSSQQITSGFMIHPDWDQSVFQNDVGLIPLNTPVGLNQYVQVISLASGSGTYAGTEGTVMGWGKTHDNDDSVSEILRYVSNPIMSNNACKSESPSYAGVITDVHLCLSGEGNKGFCLGDSGGPLVANGVQVGVVSFSYKLCEASMPSVFARVTKFYDWIKANSDIN